MQDTNSILTSIDNKLGLIITLLSNKKSKKNKKDNNNKSKKVNETKVKIIKTESKKSKNVFKEDYKKKIYLARYLNAMLLYGDTFSKKDLIKKVGGIWSYNNKGWILSNDSFDYITSNIKDLQYNKEKIFQNELLDKNNIAYKITHKNVEESNDINDYYLLNTDSD